MIMTPSSVGELVVQVTQIYNNRILRKMIENQRIFISKRETDVKQDFKTLAVAGNKCASPFVYLKRIEIR